MIKSNITLKNGEIIHFECDSAVEFGTIAKSIGSQEIQLTTNNDSRITPSKRRSPTSHEINHWSDHDILLAAKIVKETGLQDYTKATLHRMIADIRRNADGQKVRNKGTYVMVNRLRQYFINGRVDTGISRRTVAILKANGYQPGNGAVNSIKKNTGREQRLRSSSMLVQYSEQDIIRIGNLVNQNMNLRRGLTQKVYDYLRINGDKKDRTYATISSLVSAIHVYLNGGSPKAMSERFKQILDKAGVRPVGTFTRSPINANEAPSSYQMQEA